MELIKSKRVMIRKLTIEDVYHMQKWGKHTNPLYFDYNFPKLTDEEVREWFRIKTQSKRKKCFGVFNEEDRIVGYLTIKDIRKFKRTATLGIVFDPSYINRGYGTEAIITFLEYYFYDLNMKSLHLKVAKFNKRAVNCYKKCGFAKISESKIKAQVNVSDFRNATSQKDEDYFYINSKKNRVYIYAYKMKVDRSIWKQSSV